MLQTHESMRTAVITFIFNTQQPVPDALCFQPAEEMRLVSMKTPGQQLQEGSSLAELGVENDEEVAVAYRRNGKIPPLSLSPPLSLACSLALERNVRL